MAISKPDFNKFTEHPLQSWQWGEFREEWGNKIERFQIGKSKKKESIQIVFSQIPHTKLTIGTVLKGPIPTKELIEELKKVGRKHNTIFIKIEPNAAFPRHPEGTLTTEGSGNKEVFRLIQNDKTRLQSLLRKNGLVEGKTLFTPTSFWIDLTKSEDELLKSFHSKTRYNINYAKKQGVEVVEDNSDRAFEKYLKLMRETIERQGFFAHTENYHRLMWHYLHKSLILNHKSPIARLLIAKYKKKIITAWIVFVWRDFLYYPYGASTDTHKNIQSNSLMMWEAIRYGKNLGLKTFDLWGREEGKGFTRFKEGFGPTVVEFSGSWDLPLSPLYSLYRHAENVRWKILKFKNKFTKPSF